MCPNQEGVVPEVGVAIKISRRYRAADFSTETPLSQKSGYAPDIALEIRGLELMYSRNSVGTPSLIIRSMYS